MKRLFLTILAAMTLTISTGFAAFEDMQNVNEEMQTSVNTMVEKRYINGTSETEFSPYKMISRAELAAVMLRILNKMDNSLESRFSDVTKYDWYYYTAASSDKEGIIKGFEDGTFRGNDNITKAQLTAVLARVLQGLNGVGVPDIELSYSDAVPEWAVDYVKIAKSEGILNTYSDNTFGADNYVTRGNAAVMIMRTYAKITDKLEYDSFVGENAVPEPRPTEPEKTIIVLDAGHGKDSWAMSDDEKRAEGWTYNSEKGNWGEWRHWKSGTTWQDCEGWGCTGRAPAGSSCWYPITYGDRDIEPELNLNNVSYAKQRLEELGYEVRLSRPTENDNPSMTKRLIYCYPNNDTTQAPDADLFVCVHSNAGGGRGSAYIALDGYYDQAGIPADYVEKGNLLGKYINDAIVANTNLSAYSNGRYPALPELVLFCKCPIPIAYLEIGFFDSNSDLNILRSESQQIGYSIAEGIDKYCKEFLN